MFPIPKWVYYTSCHPVHTTTDELKGNMWIRIYCLVVHHPPYLNRWYLAQSFPHVDISKAS